MAAGSTCTTCLFWDRYEGGPHSLSKKLGDCRRRPPLISETLMARRMPGAGIELSDEMELDVYVASAFPVTHETSWCGEYAARNEVPLC